MLKKEGFTLIEVMIVVAIVAILSAIAIPRYQSYFDKAHQAEVSMNLASLHTAQQAYWAEHGTYTTALGGPQGLGWQPEGYKGGGKQENFYYTYGFNFPGAQEGIHFFTGRLETPKEELGATHANETAFTARAAGLIKRTKKIDRWSLDQSRAITHESNGI
jgi:prepilin-type N-terminal cleavage/methylation domain-containing protein